MIYAHVCLTEENNEENMFISNIPYLCLNASKLGKIQVPKSERFRKLVAYTEPFLVVKYSIIHKSQTN